MSSPRNRRVPLARSLALAWAGLVLASGAAQADAPVAGANDVRICGAGLKSSYEQDLALYQTPDGVRLMKIPAAELAGELAGLKSADSACAKATAAGLAVVFPGMPAIPTVDGVALVRNSPTEKNFDLLDPVVCQSFGTGGQAVRFGVNNANVDVGGWQSISYDLATRTIRLSAAQGAHGPLAHCHVFPYETTVESPPAGGPRPSDPDALFGASFENRGDLLVEILEPGTSTRVGQINVYPDIPFNYDVLVTNLGEAPLAGIVVREFLPALPRMLGSSEVVAPVLAGPWTCGGARCPTAAGTGPLALAGMTLAPGESVTLNLVRTVAADGDVGVLNVAAVAAFVDSEHPTGGSEMDPTDNAVPLVLSVQANQPPTFACTPATVNMAEDGAPVDVSCVLSDAEGDPIAPMTIANAASPAVTALLESASLVVVPNGVNTYAFTVQPKPDANGNVTLTLQTTDGVTGTAQYGLAVNVAAVNDDPEFSTYASTVVLSPTGALPTDELGVSLDDAETHLVSRGAECGSGGSDACSISISNFFEGINGGGGEDQVVTGSNPFACTTVTGTAVASAFYTRPGAGSVVAGAAELSFVYSKSMAAGTEITCSAVFTDAGGASASSTITFSMGPLPPP